MRLQKEKEGNRIFYAEDGKIQLLHKIIEGDYKVHAEYKNDNRTYVAKISRDGNFYILKIFYPRTALKKFMTRIKKGESLKTLENVTIFREKGFKELVPCIGSVEERENGMIKKEYLLMEFCEGRKPKTPEDFKKVMEMLVKFASYGRYHGDCNPGNFIIDKDENIHIIDTKLKKMCFGDYRKHFDFMVLRKHLPMKVEYPYSKNIFYYFAYFVRKIRDAKNKYHNS